VLAKFLVADDTVEQVTKLSMKFPSKRGGWLRAVEKQSKEAYKETLQAVVSEKPSSLSDLADNCLLNLSSKPESKRSLIWA